MKTTETIRSMKGKEKIVGLTAYDYQMAQILDRAGLDFLFVGDSLGMVCLGYENTLPVTLEEMIHHGKATRRGVKEALLIIDMPFLSYKVRIEDSVYNAGRLIKETGASAVKLEGGKEVAATIKAMILADIPVMGHIGLTPQAIHKIGGYKVQRQESLIDEAKALEDAGIFSLILECVPRDLAEKITEAVSVPTIGIGAGSKCDGQVLVINDLLGLTERKLKFCRRYLDGQKEIASAIQRFIEDVRKGGFPSEDEGFD
ncbi:MAG: 3-methyl-2-oxobutanoate hydroxymethyltransferase [bacterium]|nr:3-methyl-2-oxobutanoate hydroxymethyltransferase [bacterium]